MRLGFVANSKLVFDGESYRYKSGEWRYLERVASLFEEVDICTSFETTTDNYDKYASRLTVPNGKIIKLGVSDGSGYLTWLQDKYRIVSILNKRSLSWDYAFIMTPGWAALFSWWFHKRDEWPYAISARLDWAGAIAYRSSRPRWIRWGLRPYIELIRRIEYRLLRDASIRLVTGQLLINDYPQFADTSLHSLNFDLSLDDFRKRRDTCKEDTIRVVYVGALERRKAVHLLIKAVALLIRDNQQISLHVIGSGPEQSELKRLGKELSIKDRIVFHGYIHDRECLLHELFHSDIFVIPSYSEGFPRVIYEAMSQSLPIIATRVGGIPGFLENEETALLVPPGNVQEISDAICRVIKDKRLRRKLIWNGHQFAYKVVQSDPIGQAVDKFRAEIKSLQSSNSG
jgi:glycosyltransferase involved in cell wall biosynthesis